jgi:hypothetical protein
MDLSVAKKCAIIENEIDMVEEVIYRLSVRYNVNERVKDEKGMAECKKVMEEQVMRVNALKDILKDCK